MVERALSDTERCRRRLRRPVGAHHFLLGVPACRSTPSPTRAPEMTRRTTSGCSPHARPGNRKFTALANLSKVIARGGLSGRCRRSPGRSVEPTTSGRSRRKDRTAGSCCSSGETSRSTTGTRNSTFTRQRSRSTSTSGRTECRRLQPGKRVQIDEHHGSSITPGLAEEALCLDISDRQCHEAGRCQPRRRPVVGHDEPPESGPHTAVMSRDRPLEYRAVSTATGSPGPVTENRQSVPAASVRDVDGPQLPGKVER